MNKEWAFDLLLNLLLFGLLILLAAISLRLGQQSLPLVPDLGEIVAEDPEVAWLILSEIRLPRTLLGALVGFSLGLCGAALQGLLRNPLAEPGLLGASSGAALGAVTVFYFALGGGGATFALPVGGVAGALVSLVLLYLLAGRRSEMMTIILAGIAINAFAAALTSLALNFAPNPFAAVEIVFWMLGSLVDRGMDHVVFAFPLMLVGWVLVLSTGRALDALSLGEDAGASLGFNPAAIKRRIIGGTALAVGAAVAVTGIIGFVGLVVPHLMRPLTGYQPSRLLLPSALAGAVLLLGADLLVRLASPGPELKLGVVTALLGAPFFLYLIIYTRRGVSL